eukprot:Gb_36473 [translate_table: standard]
MASSVYSRSFQDSPVGVNYGRIANNLPQPEQIPQLLTSFSIQNVKTFDADPTVIQAFANTGISLTICVPNEDIKGLATDPSAAHRWIRTHVLPYYPHTRITSIAVGNEVSGLDQFSSILLKAMQNIHGALIKNNLHCHIQVSTPHSLAVLAIRFPPSEALFQVSIAESVLKPILEFLEATDSAFMINLYPYLTFKEIPEIPLGFALFEDGYRSHDISYVNGFSNTDPNSGLVYTNLFDALVDSVACAVASLGYNDVPIIVTETGWPSEGDPDDQAATLENAAIFNRRLITHITAMPPRGTPMRPGVQIPTFIFSLFDENLKFGAPTEKHWGLFYANGTKKYDLAGTFWTTPI